MTHHTNVPEPGTPAYTAASLRHIAHHLNAIAEDVESGRIPANVGSFSELHDHVDANDYSIAADEALGIEMDPSDEQWADFSNASQDVVSRALAVIALQ